MFYFQYLFQVGAYEISLSKRRVGMFIINFLFFCLSFRNVYAKILMLAIFSPQIT